MSIKAFWETVAISSEYRDGHEEVLVYFGGDYAVRFISILRDRWKKFWETVSVPQNTGYEIPDCLQVLTIRFFKVLLGVDTSINVLFYRRPNASLENIT